MKRMSTATFMPHIVITSRLYVSIGHPREAYCQALVLSAASASLCLLFSYDASFSISLFDFLFCAANCSASLPEPCALLARRYVVVSIRLVPLLGQRTSAAFAAARLGLRDSSPEPKVLPGPCCPALPPAFLSAAPEGNGTRGLASLGGAEPRTRPGPTKLFPLDSLLQEPPIARNKGKRMVEKRVVLRMPAER